MSERVFHTGHSTGEIIMGLVWLSLGALISALLEIIYLEAHVIPWTVVAAFFFNRVLTTTALLWSRRWGFIPLAAWCGCYFVITLWAGVGGDQLLPSTIGSVLLLVAGLAGGISPYLRQ